MKHVFAVLVALTLLAVPAFGQNPDAAKAVFPQVSVAPQIHINVAATGIAIDRAGYFGAMFTVVQGHVTNGSGAIQYLVLQDSSLSTGNTVWTAVDSIATDTVDNKVQTSKSYKGVNRFLRLVHRANSASSDTTFVTGMITLTDKRSR